jgi:hypothetical protein
MDPDSETAKVARAIRADLAALRGEMLELHKKINRMSIRVTERLDRMEGSGPDEKAKHY